MSGTLESCGRGRIVRGAVLDVDCKQFSMSAWMRKKLKEARSPPPVGASLTPVSRLVAHRVGTLDTFTAPVVSSSGRSSRRKCLAHPVRTLAYTAKRRQNTTADPDWLVRWRVRNRKQMGKLDWIYSLRLPSSSHQNPPSLFLQKLKVSQMAIPRSTLSFIPMSSHCSQLPSMMRHRDEQ